MKNWDKEIAKAKSQMNRSNGKMESSKATKSIDQGMSKDSGYNAEFKASIKRAKTIQKGHRIGAQQVDMSKAGDADIARIDIRDDKGADSFTNTTVRYNVEGVKEYRHPPKG